MSRLLPIAALILSAVAVAAAGLWSLDASALAPIRQADSAIGNLRSQLADLEERKRSVQTDLNRLRAASKEFATADLFLEGASAAASASMAQEHIRRLVADAGGVLLSSQATEEAIAEGTARIQVILRARLSEDGLLSLLREFDEKKPRVVLAGLELRPAPANDDLPPLEFTGVLTTFHTDAH